MSSQNSALRTGSGENLARDKELTSVHTVQYIYFYMHMVSFSNDDIFCLSFYILLIVIGKRRRKVISSIKKNTFGGARLFLLCEVGKVYERRADTRENSCQLQTFTHFLPTSNV